MSELLSLVITGATGFVGRAVIGACIANPNIKARVLVRGEKRVQVHPRVEAFSGDLESIPEMLFPDEPHVLIHMATKNLDPDGTGYDGTNIDGTQNLLQYCGESTKGIIYNSSLSVLGQAAQVDCPNSFVTNPQTDLAISRAKAEEIVFDYGKQRQRFAYSLRPRFVLGNDDQFVMPALAKLVRSGVYVGSGAQKYSIIDVDDYAQVILDLAQHCFNDVAPEQLPLNIGYERPISFSEIFQALQQKIATPPRKKVVPVPSLLAAILSKLPSSTLNSKATQLQLIGLDHYSDISDTKSRLSSNILSRNSLEYLCALASKY